MSEMSSEKTNTKAPCVLIVDDEESMRATLKRILAAAGCDVTVATGPGDALAILSANDFDVALVDRILPQSAGGVQLIKQIKSLQPFCQTILMSGFPSFESAADTLRDGTFAYITKPFERDTICQMVSEAVQQSASKRGAEQLADRVARNGHKINNLLQVIAGHCQMLMDGAEAPPAQAQQLAAICEAVQLIRSQVRDLVGACQPDGRAFEDYFAGGEKSV